MGTWGPALFSDDTACDVRDRFTGLIGDGLEAAAATKQLLGEWEEELRDPDMGTVIWLALAATQWKLGRLQRDVHEKALDVIDSGADLRRWEEAGLTGKRERVLLKLRDQLMSPQPPVKKVKQQFRDSSEWEVGDVIAYRLRSGQYTLFRMIGAHTDQGGTSPIFEMLDWVGPEIPSPEIVRRLNVKKETGIPAKPIQFMVGRVRKKELPADRIMIVAKQSQPKQRPGGFLVFVWGYLDRQLEESFGIA